MWRNSRWIADDVNTRVEQFGLCLWSRWKTDSKSEITYRIT